jgi:hypothetical protein
VSRLDVGSRVRTAGIMRFVLPAKPRDVAWNAYYWSKLCNVTETPDSRWKQRLSNFVRALDLLQDALKDGPAMLSLLPAMVNNCVRTRRSASPL